MCVRTLTYMSTVSLVLIMLPNIYDVFQYQFTTIVGNKHKYRNITIGQTNNQTFVTNQKTQKNRGTGEMVDNQRKQDKFTHSQRVAATLLHAVLVNRKIFISVYTHMYENVQMYMCVCMVI